MSMGAVGVAGLSKEIDAEIANTAATALSPSPMTAQRSYCSCAPVGAEDDAIARSGVWPPNEVRRSHQSQRRVPDPKPRYALLNPM
jgi:hypothetical protein